MRSCMAIVLLMAFVSASAVHGLESPTTHGAEPSAIYNAKWCEIELANGRYIYGNVKTSSDTEYVIEQQVHGLSYEKSHKKSDKKSDKRLIERRIPIAGIKRFGYTGTLKEIALKRLEAIKGVQDREQMVHWYADMNLNAEGVSFFKRMKKKHIQFSEDRALLQRVHSMESALRAVAQRGDRKSAWTQGKNVPATQSINDRIRIKNKKQLIKKHTHQLQQSQKELLALQELYAEWSQRIPLAEKEMETLVLKEGLYKEIIAAAIAKAAGTSSHVPTDGDQTHTGNQHAHSYDHFLKLLQDVQGLIQSKKDFISSVQAGLLINTQKQEKLVLTVSRLHNVIAVKNKELLRLLPVLPVLAVQDDDHKDTSTLAESQEEKKVAEEVHAEVKNLPKNTTDISARHMKSIALIKTYDQFNKNISTGSGFCFDPSGMIASNYHLIQGATIIVVVLNEQRYIAEVRAQDTLHDVAILQISLNEAQCIELDAQSVISIGDTCTIISAQEGVGNVLSQGKISAQHLYSDKTYADKIWSNKKHAGEVVETTIPALSAHSGAPLLNSAGRVIGLMVSTGADDGTAGPRSFAVPVKWIQLLLEKTKNKK